jgi:hypothetical protein
MRVLGLGTGGETLMVVRCHDMFPVLNTLREI